MKWSDWYTDTVDVYRVMEQKSGNLTRHTRKQILAAVPGRIYRSDEQPITPTQDSAFTRQADKLMLAPDTDIRAGDELIIHKGAKLGRNVENIRAFAAEPSYFFEPFGAVIPGLAHMEIRLLQQERIGGGITDESETENEAAGSNKAAN